MNALELVLLGRRLAAIGEQAIRGSAAPAPGRGVGLVLADAFARPDSAIGEIARRTGLPQSYVSEAVARLREQGIVETAPDPGDGRRTLVRVTAAHERHVAALGAVSVDERLGAALGAGPDELAELLDVLARLGERLRPAEPGPAGRLLAGGDDA